MSARSHLSLLVAISAALALGSAACAAQPTPPAAAAAPPSQAFQQASTTGVTAPQGQDDFQFVPQDRKEPTVSHDDATPTTALHADSKTTRPGAGK